MAQSKYFPNLENGVDNANVEQVEQAFSDVETDVNNILNTKQDTLTFDDTPTSGSTNPVTSGGVKTVLDDKLDKTDAVGQKTAEGGEIFNSAISAGSNAHAEGSDTHADGSYSHAEGSGTTAMADNSHVEGYNSVVIADANFAHVEGWYAVAASPYQHVQGKCNIRDNTNTYAHIVGNGANPEERSNAHTLDWNGNAWYKGDVKIGGTSYDDSAAKALATIDDVRPAVKNTIDTIAVNTIYDLGIQTTLNITLPSGQIGDFIEFDFISGETATTLTVTSSSGLVGFDLIPGTNTIYTLYFDWGVAGYDGTSITHGWRCNYSEYSITV